MDLAVLFALALRLFVACALSTPLLGVGESSWTRRDHPRHPFCSVTRRTYLRKRKDQIMETYRNRTGGRPCLSEKGPMNKLLTMPITDSQRAALWDRARQNGYRVLADFIRSRLEIGLDD